MTTSCSPRVIGATRPDFHSLESFLAGACFRGKQGERLVMALYDYLTSPEDGIYHFWPSDESAGRPQARWASSAPLRTLNAYGWAICGQTAELLRALYRTAGMPARVFGAPGHVLCEVFYEDRWHVLDVDMWTWFRTPAGHLASAAELARDPAGLILNNPQRSNPCDLPDRPLPSYAEMYGRLALVGDDPRDVWPALAFNGFDMDFLLRPGETLLRSQEHEGRFHMPQSWKENVSRFASEWVGHPRERFHPFLTFGNGRWIYAPNLGSDFGDVAAGVWEPATVGQDHDGLVGPGEATFRMQSPYPFCGVPDWSAERIRHRDGVFLELSGCGPLAADLLSAEEEWVRVADFGGPFDRTLDITEHLAGRYETVLRIRMEAGSRLRKFRFDGRLMTAPLSLPRLVKGRNRIEVRGGDKHGLDTAPWTRIVDFRAGRSLPSQWVAAENAAVQPHAAGWTQIAPAGAGPVRVVFRFAAPPLRPIAWFLACAAVREGPPDTLSHVSLEWSPDGRDWFPAGRAEIRNTRMGWDFTVDGEVRPSAPLSEVWLRVTADGAITAAALFGHAAVPAAAGTPVEIRHSWTEDGNRREFLAPPGADSYTIACDGAPSGHTIGMKAASVPRRRS